PELPSQARGLLHSSSFVPNIHVGVVCVRCKVAHFPPIHTGRKHRNSRRPRARTVTAGCRQWCLPKHSGTSRTRLLPQTSATRISGAFAFCERPTCTARNQNTCGMAFGGHF